MACYCPQHLTLYYLFLSHALAEFLEYKNVLNDCIFTGEGVFVLNGAVEDSATAEISRSQVGK